MMVGWSMDLGAWLLMGAWMLALVVAVLLLVWTPRRHQPDEDPRSILRARLARGEISAEEFERAIRLLGSDARP